MKSVLCGVAAITLFMTADFSTAHHSYGMFDRNREEKVSGTVKEFQWTNPHSRLALIVPNAQGNTDVWDLETGPPGQLARSGWKRNSLRAGDKVEVLIYPLRDGKPGGHLLMVTNEKGEKFYDVVFNKPDTAPRT